MEFHVFLRGKENSYVYRMNTRFASAIGILMLFFVFVSFKPYERSDYRIDIQRSSLSWEGHKFFGGKHTGTINLQRGQCIVEGNKLKSGHFNHRHEQHSGNRPERRDSG